MLPTPTGWMFRLDAVKAFSTDPPDDSLLLAGLSDERGRAQLSTLSYASYLNRLAALEQALRGNGQWLFPHPWLTTFIGDAAVESVSRELEVLEPADLGPFGQVVLSAFPRQAVSSPLLQLPADDLVYAFDLGLPLATIAPRLNVSCRQIGLRTNASSHRVARSTRSVRSRCPVTTGAGTLGQPFTSCVTPSISTTLGTSLPRATRSLGHSDRHRARRLRSCASWIRSAPRSHHDAF